MKKKILKMALVLLMLGSTTVQAHKTPVTEISISKSKLTTTFGVRGNCGMCKATIEKAALSVSGVKKAEWDATSKKITVTYVSEKTNLDEIHKAIAHSGYDIEMVEANDSEYDKLHGCCRYDRKMSIATKKTTDVKTNSTQKSCCSGSKSKGCH